MVIINGIEFKISNNTNKKYMAKPINSNKWVHFGAKGYDHYYDKIGMYSSYNHTDKKRRQNYRNRHSKIYTKDGIPAYKKKYSPSWYSWHYLW